MQLNNPAEGIINGKFDNVFKRLYTQEDIQVHRNRWLSLIDLHLKRFKDLPLRLFSAAGRTELAGNHTDHNNGRVLAATVQLDTIAAVTQSDDMLVELLSEGYPPVRVDLRSLEKSAAESGSTDALVRGIAASMVKRKGRIGGFRASTCSQVLKGSGLSSSAALEVLVASIFNELYNKGQFNTLDLAIMGQEAENNYFGKPSGLMDQIASAMGGAVAIDFGDPANPAVEKLSTNFSEAGYTLAVLNSRGDHADLTPDYAAIPAEMHSVAAELDCDILREASEEKFYSSLSEMRNKTGDRAILRALHFFNENRRVERMLHALRENDFTTYLEGVRSSGDSSYRFLQNVYSSRNPRVQALSLALALTERFLNSSGASRVHGGGFAGTIQVYVPSDRFHSYRVFMDEFFGEGSVLELSIRQMPAGEIIAKKK